MSRDGQQATAPSEGASAAEATAGAVPVSPPVTVATTEVAPKPAKPRIYTPKRGSAERTAILDAVRANGSYKGQFVVRELHVQGDWAVADLQPAEDWEESWGFSIYAVHRENGRWADVLTGDTGDTSDPEDMIRKAWADWGVPPSLIAVHRFK